MYIQRKKKNFGIILGWIEYSIYIFKKIILLCNVHDNPTKDKKI